MASLLDTIQDAEEICSRKHTFEHVLSLSIHDAGSRLQVLRSQELGHGDRLGVSRVGWVHRHLVCRLLGLWLLCWRRRLSRLPRLSRLRRSLALSLSFGLLLVCGHGAHPQLGHVLLGGHAMLGSFGVELFALLLRELFGGHSSLCGLSSELLLHGRHLLGAWLAGRRHCEGGIGGCEEAEDSKREEEGEDVVRLGGIPLGGGC